MSDTNETGTCCTGAVDFVARDNPPGKSALSYRLGVHGQFLARMLARLPAQVVEGARPLAALTTRSTDDPAIALLDAWACVADVLCFYQERIANEGYLRTATERESVLQLAREIGYELNPGVAAAAYLAFTVDDNIGAATIPVGVQIQSVPGQDEKPQLFETVEEIDARAEWNAIRPRKRKTFPPDKLGKYIYLDGVDTGLEPGSPVLITGYSDPPDFHYLTGVEVDKDHGVTKIRWDTKGVETGTVERKALDPFSKRVMIPASMKVPAGEGELDTAPSDDPSSDDETEDGVAVYTFGVQAFVYSVDDIVTTEETSVPIQLDAYYAGIARASWLVPSVGKGTVPVRVKKSVASTYKPDAESTATVHALTVTVTVPKDVDTTDWDSAVIHAQNVALTPAGEPRRDRVKGSEIALEGTFSDLPVGRTVTLSGRAYGSDEDADPVGEVAVIAEVTTDDEGTTITLASPLENIYEREDLVINANVAKATHGETVSAEIIGSGDATTPHQVMALRQTPLTFVPAATPTGGESTLSVAVNGVAWDAVASLYGQDADARVFATRVEDDGSTGVYFGDGVSGARLPTGKENVTASYRKGLGAAGNVAARKLTQLKTRPLGVRSVTNPAAASGGADAEVLDDARANAPLATRTLDRVVSLRDYEDFARAFAGIAKATAIAAWDGARKVVHVTVAGEDGARVPESSETYTTLLAALAANGDPGARVAVESFERVRVKLSAGILYDPAYDADTVTEAIESALTEAFGFDARDLAEPLTSAEVIATIQGVAGVTAVDLDALYRADDASASLASVLVARPATWDAASGAILPAELLVLAEHGITLTELSA